MRRGRAREARPSLRLARAAWREGKKTSVEDCCAWSRKRSGGRDDGRGRGGRGGSPAQADGKILDRLRGLEGASSAPRARRTPRRRWIRSQPPGQKNPCVCVLARRAGGPRLAPIPLRPVSDSSDPPFSPQTHHPSAIECFERFRAAASGKLLTVFLDYDGTISPIVNKPDEAFMSDEMRAAVQRVASLYPTAIISGRAREKVYDFVRLPELYYAGSHGLDIVAPSAEGSSQRDLHQPAPWAPEVMDAVYKECVAAVANIPGASVDHNKFCVSVHYRNCEAKEDWTRVKAVVDACVAADPARLKQAEGRKVFEVKPRVAWDKGKALSYLLSQLGLEGKYDAGEVLSLYFGDDHTDEDAFHELRGFPEGTGCGVIVSSVPKPSNAVFSVRDPAEVLVFLNSIAHLAESGETKSLNTSATIQGGG